MKRMLSFFLVCAVLLTVTACTGKGGADGQAAFYYKRAQLSYGEADGVVTPEYRTVDRNGDMMALLNAYVDGPKVTELSNVFPLGCDVLWFSLEGEIATVHFNKAFDQVQGIAQTIACVCMSRTVMELTGAKRVRISAESISFGGNEYLEFNGDSALYFDAGR